MERVSFSFAGSGARSSQSDTLQVKFQVLVKQIGGAASPFIFY